MTTAELLTVWRSTTRATELADLLAQVAHDAAVSAGSVALGSEELAELAEQAALAAAKVAQRPRAVAAQAREAARDGRQVRLAGAQASAAETHSLEDRARDEYHASEAEAKRRLEAAELLIAAAQAQPGR